MPYLTGFGLAAASVAGATAYLLGGGSQPALASAAAMGGAILGQLALLGLQLSHSDELRAKLKRAVRDAVLAQETARDRTTALEARVNHLAAEGESRARAVVGGLSDLKTSYQDLQRSLTQAMANAPQPVVVEPVAQFPAESLMAAPEEQPFEEAPVPPPAPAIELEDEALGDKIFFALEPIVDIPSSRTAHYILHLSMEINGEEMGNDKLLHFASRVGKRPVLDLLAVREAFVLLKKLRQRDPDLLIFVDIGAETLAEPQALQRLVAARRAAGALANGAVLQLPHAALAGLSEGALEGLATLARDGAHFALSKVSVSALDLQAMNMLNVRHVGVSAGTIDADGPSTSLVGFAQVARLSRINIIITGMNNALLIPKLGSVTRLACGPCFAAPRRVRRQAAQSETTAPIHLAA